MTLNAQASTQTTFVAGAITGVGEVELLDITHAEPDPGEALVRIEATAICTWEQRTYSGAQENRLPFIGGHEIVGTIVEFGPGYKGTLNPGDRVALGSAACGSCHWCHLGKDQLCAEHYSGAVEYAQGWGPGGFAEYKIHPADGLYPIGDVPAVQASLTEPLSCALHAARLSGVEIGDDVVILGAGVMGLMNLIAMKKHGARVIVSEVDAGRLEKAKALGADLVIDASKVDPVAAVLEATEGRGASIAVAAIGHRIANEQGLAMLANRGTFVAFAAAHPETPIEVSPNHLHKSERRIIGVVSSEKRDFHDAARLVRLGLVDLSPLVQNTYPLAELKSALDEAIQPGTYRIVIEA
ncbi:zinc-dependent alcohol dehydrogenase [Humidisolicoccus flavus]|uniref:zinc-dependent alcohol dehydrogenase n=1 Tax=Humidisolicoccus flavus TaxID=3111414 RepID=UPI00324E099E